MTVSILLLVGMVACFAAGISLMLERSLTRMVLGFLLVGNATNLLVFFMSGSYGAAPIYDPDLAPDDYSDPLPQAFILTAIVITFGVTAFLLALVYRSWRLAQVDTVEDDEEDIAMRTVDPTKDDEPFDEEDAGDTEFGSLAEAAVSSAVVDLSELETLADYTDEHEADREAVDELQDESEDDLHGDVRGEEPAGVAPIEPPEPYGAAPVDDAARRRERSPGGRARRDNSRRIDTTGDSATGDSATGDSATGDSATGHSATGDSATGSTDDEGRGA